MRKTILFVGFLTLLLVGCNTPASLQLPLATPASLPVATALSDAPLTAMSAPPTPTPDSISTESFLPLALGGSPTVPIEATIPAASASPTPEYPAYNGPPLLRDNIGVQIHLHREDLDQIINHLQALGVGWVKVQVSWKHYQPEPDRYDDARFRELDQLVSRATSHDIKVLLSVAKAPEWSRPTTEMDGPPSDYTHFQTFMGTLALRYQGNLAAYELWNEPNLQREWNGSPLSGADYVELIRRGAAGVRNADPHALLISGAPATTGIDDGIVAIDDRRFLQQMLDAGVDEFVDAVGVHPYGWANPPDAGVANPDPVAPTHNSHPSFFFADTLADYRRLLGGAGMGATALPLWATEFGWGSFEGFGAPPPAGAEFMQYVSEWQQAQYTLRAYEMAHLTPNMGPIFLWNLNFAPLLGAEFSEAGYSLLALDGAPRPVFKALQALPKQ